MSERGQKIFKIITWIVIGILVAYNIAKLATIVSNPDSLEDLEPVTRTEWMTMLSDGFGDETLLEGIENGDENATGEYAALSAMNAIGDERLSYLTEDELTDNKKIELAVEKEVVSKKQLDDDISQGEAEEILNNALNIYTDPDYYPEYFEADTNGDVLDADRWESLSYDEDSQTISADINEEVPQVGEVIMYTDEYGIAHAKTVDAISENGNGNYSLQVSNVEDASQLFNSISFSGAGDFGYLSGSEDVESSLNSVEESASANPFIMTAYAAENEPIQVAEWERFEDKTALKSNDNADTEKCDIEFNVEIKDTDKNGKEKETVTSYISVKSDGVTRKYKYSIDDSGKEQFTANVSNDDGLNFEFSEDDKSSKSLDTGYMKDELGVTANVKLTNFSVCTSGYYQWADPDDSKNFVEVMASAEKVNISSSAKLSSEDKYLIGSLPIPIASTAGVVSVDLNVYLVISASGELTLWYEIDDPYVGINVSTANGVKPLHGCSNEDAGVKAKIELGGGFIGEAAVMVLETVDLADPGVDARAYASASTIDVKDTYKLKDEYAGTSCIELKAQAPVVKLTATAGEDSVLYAILDTLKVQASYDLIKKDENRDPQKSWLKKITYHVEENDDGTVTVTKLKDSQKHEDVCTHIEKKSQAELDAEGIKDDIDTEINNKVNEVEDAAKSKLEQMLEDAINEWLEENCGGC